MLSIMALFSESLFTVNISFHLLISLLMPLLWLSSLREYTL